MVPILSPALAIQYPDGALVTYEEWRWVLGQPQDRASVAPALGR